MTNLQNNDTNNVQKPSGTRNVVIACSFAFAALIVLIGFAVFYVLQSGDSDKTSAETRVVNTTADVMQNVYTKENVNAMVDGQVTGMKSEAELNKSAASLNSAISKKMESEAKAIDAVAENIKKKAEVARIEKERADKAMVVRLKKEREDATQKYEEEKVKLEERYEAAIMKANGMKTERYQKEGLTLAEIAKEHAIKRNEETYEKTLERIDTQLALYAD